MAKEVICTDGLGRGRIEVLRRVKVESDDEMKVENEEDYGRSLKGAEMNEREGEVRKEGKMWGDGEVEGECARWEEKKVNVDVHEKGKGADRVSEWHDDSAEDGRVHVDKSEDRFEDIRVYVPKRILELSNDREVQAGVIGDEFCMIVVQVSRMTIVKGGETCSDGWVCAERVYHRCKSCRKWQS